MEEMTQKELWRAAYQKLKAENEAFLQQLIKGPLSPERLVTAAYQIVYQEEALFLMEEENFLRKGEWKVLLEAQYPVFPELYSALDERYGVNLELDTIAESIREWIVQEQEKTAKKLFANPLAPLYAKRGDDAWKDGETVFWNADFKLSQRCGEEFQKMAEQVSSLQFMKEWLPKWQEKYGQERCLQVLTCMLDYRGIYSDNPIIEQAMDKMAEEHKRLEYNIRWIVPTGADYLDKNILLYATEWLEQHSPVVVQDKPQPMKANKSNCKHQNQKAQKKKQEQER